MNKKDYLKLSYLGICIGGGSITKEREKTSIRNLYFFCLDNDGELHIDTNTFAFDLNFSFGLLHLLFLIQYEHSNLHHVFFLSRLFMKIQQALHLGMELSYNPKRSYESYTGERVIKGLKKKKKGKMTSMHKLPKVTPL